jgi:hypothetical protein
MGWPGQGMISKKGLLAVWTVATLCGLWVTWRMNALEPAELRPIAKDQIEAVIVEGHGTLIATNQQFKTLRKDLVVFQVENCVAPIYVLPGALHSEAFLTLSIDSALDDSHYFMGMAYNSDVAPPPPVVVRYLNRFWYDATNFLGTKSIKNSRYALFMMIPKACDISNRFNWKRLWL